MKVRPSVISVWLLVVTNACSGEVDSDLQQPGGALPVPPGGGAVLVPPGAPGTPGTPGTPGAPGTPGGPVPPSLPTNCDAALVATSPLSRLTRAEYDQSVRDLLGLDLGLAESFTADAKLGPFDANQIEPVSELVVSQYFTAAEQAGLAVVEGGASAFAPACDLAQPTQSQSCADLLISDFLPRAFRRPIDAEEKQQFKSLFDLGMQGEGLGEAIRNVIAATLSSPYFIYRPETGGQSVANAAPGAVISLSAHELATRLAYSLTASTPDRELLQAAGDNTLMQLDVRRAQALRLLDGPGAQAAFGNFGLQWMAADRTASLQKVDEDFTPQLALAMEDEIAKLTASTMLSAAGKFAELYTSTQAWVTPELAALYGVAFPQPGAPAAMVTLPATERAGLTTRAAFLASTSHAVDTSPTRRGMRVREDLLCQTVPPPPPNVNAELPPRANDGDSLAVRLAAHSTNPACSGCHTLIDPIGLGLENYDAVGRYRSDDDGAPINGVGELTGAGTATAFTGGVELAARLAASPAAEECFAKQLLTYVHRTFPKDACVVGEVFQAYKAGNGNVRELLVYLVTRPEFGIRVTGGVQ